MCWKRAWYKVVGVWEAVQVELHSQYSLQRLKAFREYSQSSSFARVFIIMLLTPIPCLIAVGISDSIPLQPPELGIGHTQGYWIRGMFTAFICSYAAADQIQYYVPQLHVSQRERIAVSPPGAFFSNGVAYLLSRAIGFPLPFALTLSPVPWSFAFFSSVWILRGRFLRQNPEVLCDFLGCQLSMVVLYPLFYSAFSSLSPSGQTKFVLLLPVMMFFEKNLLHHVFTDQDDVKPELVIFNVEIFNALFVSCCMQSSSSINTNLAIMAADFLQACAGIYDLDKMLVDVHQLTEKMRVQEGQIIEIAMQVLRNTPGIARHESIRKLTDEPDFAIPVATVKGNQIAPQPHHDVFEQASGDRKPDKPGLIRGPTFVKPVLELPVDPASSRIASISDKLSDNERLLFVQKVLQILYLTEFLLLIEFTEVMIPVVYCKCGFSASSCCSSASWAYRMCVFLCARRVLGGALSPTQPRVLPSGQQHGPRRAEPHDVQRVHLRDDGVRVVPRVVPGAQAQTAHLGDPPADVCSGEAVAHGAVQAGDVGRVYAAGHSSAPRCDVVSHSPTMKFRVDAVLMPMLVVDCACADYTFKFKWLKRDA